MKIKPGAIVIQQLVNTVIDDFQCDIWPEHDDAHDDAHTADHNGQGVAKHDEKQYAAEHGYGD